MLIATMPAGTYWIGDLCYVLNDVWDEFCNDLTEGDHTLGDGRMIAWMHTKWGDGSYNDQFGKEYPVDAGLIGCILVEDITDPAADISLGNVYTFSESDSFTVEKDVGVLIFGHVRIDTDPEYNMDEDEDEVEDEDSDFFESEEGE